MSPHAGSPLRLSNCGMHSVFSVSRTASPFGVPMPPETMLTPASMSASTTPGVCVGSYWSSRMSTLSLTPSTRLLSLAYCMYSLKPSVTGAKATAGVPDSGWYEPTLSSPSIGALAASGSAQSSVLAFHASAGASLADGAVTSAVLSGASVSDGGVVSATLDAVVTAPPPVVVADDSLLSSLPHAASSRTPTAVRAARCLPLRIIGFFSPLG